MAISQNFPNTRPSLNLNFARSKKLDPRITFTRSSTATYVDEDGLIKSAATNTPRFDHDPTTGDCLGLLIEESRTNLLKYSNAFSTGGAGNWGSVSATCVFTQNITGPDGVSNGAWTIDDQSTVADGAGFEEQLTITPSASTNYCLSIFAKQGTATYFDFYAFFTGTSVKGTYFRYNFSTDTISVSSADGGGISPTIYGKVQYPNGWYRLYFVVNDANSGLNNTLQYRIYPASRDAGVTGTTLFYGAQCEIGSFPTTYIPTTTATVTRSADSASITGTNFTSWYNPDEGSVSAKFKFYANHGSYSEAVSIAGAGSGFMVIDVAGGLVTDCYSANTVVTGGNNARNTFVTGVRAYKFSTNDSVIGCSGASSITTQTGTKTNPNPTTMWLGRRGDGGGSVYMLNGHLQQVSYYPVRLSNSQLQTLTK